MAERYIKFNTEVSAMAASHAALEYAGEYHPGSKTYYLFPWRQDIDGNWWIIYTSHPDFARYETKAFPPPVRNKLTDIEPTWMPDEVV